MKKTRILAATLCFVLVFSAGVFAANVYDTITAQVRTDYTITLDGTVQTLKDGKGNVIYPLSHDGTTYLPVRAVAEMAGLDVDWIKDTKTVKLTTPATGGTQTPAKPDTSTGTDASKNSYKDTLASYNKEAEALKTEADKVTKVSDLAKNRETYRAVKLKIDSLEDKLDLLEDQIEAEYKSGKMTQQAYKDLDQQLEAVEDTLSYAEDTLEYRLGIDD